MTAPGAARVLVVEDEPALGAALVGGLRREGFAVERATDGLLALDLCLNRPFDAIVLDLMLPGLAGLDLCARLRSAGIGTPVLVLTARAGENDQLRAFRIGADDFLSKPFSYRVLLARLHALLRRTGPHGSATLAAGDLVLDRATRCCTRGSVHIALTPREFALLELFMSRPGRVITKRYALDEVWDLALSDESNVLEVYIKPISAASTTARVNRYRNITDQCCPVGPGATSRHTGDFTHHPIWLKHPPAVGAEHWSRCERWVHHLAEERSRAIPSTKRRYSSITRRTP